eukprot:4577447-Alexandrium_andersonii.AAC.1
MPRTAMLRHTMPCHATPHRSHAILLRATPGNAVPRHAMPCDAYDMPSKGKPTQTKPCRTAR